MAARRATIATAFGGKPSNCFSKYLGSYCAMVRPMWRPNLAEPAQPQKLLGTRRAMTAKTHYTLSTAGAVSRNAEPE
jgi:hypothetical protein